MSPESGSWQGTLGLIRAHERASIDQFLAHAGAERGRLEALVEQAEERYIEAGVAYEAAIAEYDRIADQLGTAWQELQAEREHAALTVQERLQEVRARPTRFPLPPPPAESLTGTAAAATTWDDDEELTSWGETEGSAGGIEAPTPAFAFASHPTESLRPTEVLSVVPAAPAPAPAPPRPPEQPAVQGEHPDFWRLEEAAATLRAGQLEGTLTALLPMVALVIVLVVVLAWIG